MHTRPKRESSVSGGWNSDVIFGTKFWNIFGSKFLRTLVSHTITLQNTCPNMTSNASKNASIIMARGDAPASTPSPSTRAVALTLPVNTQRWQQRRYQSRATTPRGADGIHYAQVWCSLRLQKRLLRGHAPCLHSLVAQKQCAALCSACCQMHSAKFAPHTLFKQV